MLVSICLTAILNGYYLIDRCEVPNFPLTTNEELFIDLSEKPFVPTNYSHRISFNIWVESRTEVIRIRERVKTTRGYYVLSR